MCRAFRYVKLSPVKCLRPDCATHFALCIQQFIVYRKIAKNPTFICRFQLSPVELKNGWACQLSDVCRTHLFQLMSSLYILRTARGFWKCCKKGVGWIFSPWKSHKRTDNILRCFHIDRIAYMCKYLLICRYTHVCKSVHVNGLAHVCKICTICKFVKFAPG